MQLDFKIVYTGFKKYPEHPDSETKFFSDINVAYEQALKMKDECKTIDLCFYSVTDNGRSVYLVNKLDMKKDIWEDEQK